jgi:ssDNA-binding Zn-finger/Zn-ribbon topoisomerase 1
VANPKNVRFINKPHCPKCKKPMHSYMKGVDYIRFRCSNYPQCKTYLKVHEVEFEIVDAVMISKDLSIEQFLNEVQGKPLWEVFHLANEEAMAAERLLMRAKPVKKKKRKKISKYIDKLSSFMLFLQSSIKLPRTSKKSNILFWRYWDSINQRNKPNFGR